MRCKHQADCVWGLAVNKKVFTEDRKTVPRIHFGDLVYSQGPMEENIAECTFKNDNVKTAIHILQQFKFVYFFSVLAKAQCSWCQVFRACCILQCNDFMDSSVTARPGPPRPLYSTARTSGLPVHYLLSEQSASLNMEAGWPSLSC